MRVLYKVVQGPQKHEKNIQECHPTILVTQILMEIFLFVILYITFTFDFPL